MCVRTVQEWHWLLRVKCQTQGSVMSDGQVYVCTTILPSGPGKAMYSPVGQLMDLPDEQEYLLNVHHMSTENILICPVWFSTSLKKR